MLHKKLMGNSRSTTDTLKGIAIIAVLVNHYLNQYVSGDYGGFAYLFLSVFFFLSGYGIYISFEERSLKKITTGIIITNFYNRVIKIFPLFWIALCLQSYITGFSYPPISYTGFYAVGHYWFIPFILHCYIASPFLYMLLKKGVIKTIIAAGIFLILVNIFYGKSIFPETISTFIRFNFFYGKICLFHVYLFLLGMSFGMLSKHFHIVPNKIKKYKRSYHIFWSLWFSIAFVMIAIRYSDKQLFFSPTMTLIISAAIITASIYSISQLIEIKIFKVIGFISYSLYLFHMSYYSLLSKSGFFNKDSLLGVVCTISLLPLLYYFCFYANKAGTVLADKIKIRIL